MIVLSHVRPLEGSYRLFASELNGGRGLGEESGLEPSPIRDPPARQVVCVPEYGSRAWGLL